MAAFKRSVHDEWLARHLGEEKLRTMATLTSLMTRFCAGEDSWLARCSTSDPSTSEVEMETRNHGATITNAGIKKTARRAWQ